MTDGGVTGSGVSEHKGARPFLSLTTDFGPVSTAICAGVMTTIVPEANLLVVTHDVRPYQIQEGAFVLWRSLPYLPVGTHVVVVDPGVGTDRRPVAIETGRGDVLVGPDNGVLDPVGQRLGGARRAHLLEAPEYRLPTVSSTFHGRDVFSPAGAHIALGLDLARLGPPVELADLVHLEVAEVESVDGGLRARVLYVDEFGSLVLNATQEHLGRLLGSTAPGTALELARPGAGTGFGTGAGVGVGPGGGDRVLVPLVTSFGQVPRGELLVYPDSAGWLGLAVNQGSAAERLGLGENDVVELRLAGGPAGSS